MKESLHYLLMSDHFLFQKALVSSVRDTGLTPGQPKILDYLIHHDGAIQKEIAISCHIEPASLTAILNGMETKGYIERRTDGGNRRSYHVYLTPLGKKYADRLSQEFARIEEKALEGFSDSDAELLQDLLGRVYNNMTKNQKEGTHK